MTHAFEVTCAVAAPLPVVWECLTRPEHMREWMGTPEMRIVIDTDWGVGHPLIVRGFHHAPFVNTGVVVDYAPMTRLSYTHLSSLSRLPAQPESYTALSFQLVPVGDTTALSLVAANFPTDTIYKHLQLYWRGTLTVLKRYAEQQAVRRDGSTAYD